MVMRPLLFLLTIPLAVGILFPLGALVGEAFSGTTSAGDVLGMLLSPPMLRAVGNTLWVGGLTALLSTVLGGILAYTMTLTKAPGRKALGWLFMAPLLAPSFMPAMGLVYLFGNYGLLFPTQLYGVPGLLAGGVLFTLPHTTLQLSLAFRTLDQRLLDAALLLGSDTGRRFRTVLLPHLRDAVVNALLIAFVLTVTDFGVPKLLGGNVPMLATEIYKYAIGLADFQRAALLSFWLMVPSLLAFGAYTLLSRRKEERGTPQPLRIEPNLGRDAFFGGLSWFIVAGMLASIAAVMLASFVQAWPYDRTWTLEAYSLTSLSYGIAPVVNSLGLAFSTALSGVLLAWVTSVLMTRHKEAVRPVGAFFHAAALLPMAVPGTILGLGFAMSLSGWEIFSGVWGNRLLVLFNTLVHLFTVGYLTLSTSLKALPATYEAAGLLLGRGYAYTTMRVLAPLCGRPLRETFAYFFSNALTTISALVFLYSPETITGAVAALQSLDAGYLASGAAMATIIFALNVAFRGLLIRN